MWPTSSVHACWHWRCVSSNCKTKKTILISTHFLFKESQYVSELPERAGSLLMHRIFGDHLGPGLFTYCRYMFRKLPWFLIRQRTSLIVLVKKMVSVFNILLKDFKFVTLVNEHTNVIKQDLTSQTCYLTLLISLMTNELKGFSNLRRNLIAFTS